MYVYNVVVVIQRQAEPPCPRNVKGRRLEKTIDDWLTLRRKEVDEEKLREKQNSTEDPPVYDPKDARGVQSGCQGSTGDTRPSTSYDESNTPYSQYPKRTSYNEPTGTSYMYNEPNPSYGDPCASYKKYPSASCTVNPSASYNEPKTGYEEPCTSYTSASVDEPSTSRHELSPSYEESSASYSQYPSANYDEPSASYDEPRASYSQYPSASYSQYPGASYEESRASYKESRASNDDSCASYNEPSVRYNVCPYSYQQQNTSCTELLDNTTFFTPKSYRKVIYYKKPA